MTTDVSTDDSADESTVLSGPGTAVDYLPSDPVGFRPAIGMIGCGNISGMHLAAYRRAGYDVVALCDLDTKAADARRAEFYPQATVCTDYRELLARADVQVVDITVHVEDRPAIVRAAIDAGKHVLSQKPFVKDLGEGEELARRADEAGRVLAVNQNGRWAPHFAYLLQASAQGLIGEVVAADFAVHWPHDLVVSGHPVFSVMEDLIIYDFAIHWFDVIAQLFRAQGPAVEVYAVKGTTPGQAIPVPTWAQISITFEKGAATLVLRGAAHRLEEGRYRVDGTEGVITHDGLSLGGETVRLVTDDIDQVTPLVGDWWDNGMHGAMAELLTAVHQRRTPSNAARSALPGLSLCFAALESARTGRPVDPRTITRIPE